MIIEKNNFNNFLVYNFLMFNGEKYIKKIIPSLVLGLDLFVLVIDKNGQILYQNDCLKKKFGAISNLSQIDHYFSFDVCIINEDEILAYSPFKAAISSHENFFAAVSFEEDRYIFRSAILKSFSLNQNKILIISFDDMDSKDARLADLEKEVSELKTVVEENKSLKQKAENQSVKTALINRISSIIRNSFNLSEIIKKTLSETLKTLGAEGIAYFNKEDLKNPKLKIDFEEDISFCGATTELVISQEKLIVPVTHEADIVGYLAIKLPNFKRVWQKDEIQLVENIASQLAIAVNQVGLFNEVERQKKDLQKTLEELKKTQVQLVQSEKMAALGQLVAGIAHEINTPLGAINSNNDIVRRCTEKLEEGNLGVIGVLKNVLPITQDATDRINVLVKSLKNFARLDEAEFQEADLNEGISSTLDLIRHEIKGRINIVRDFGVLPKVQCKPNAINQVFMNILVNAYQSIEGDGQIIIATYYEDGNVFVKIKDSGKGILQKDLARIFDPGFTTKGVGVGTGLGLSISYEIIKDHHGEITVSSEIGCGTEFLIRLPMEHV